MNRQHAEMEISQLINHLPIHDSPSAERFYRLQLQREQAPVQQRTVRAKEFTRDDRIRIKTIRDITDWPYWVIAQKYRAPDRTPSQRWTARQIQYACKQPLTPRKTGSRKRLLISAEEREKLKRFIESDRAHRKIPWQDLRFFVPGFEKYSTKAVTSAMVALGYKRKVQKRTLRLTARTRQKRVEFAR